MRLCILRYGFCLLLGISFLSSVNADIVTVGFEDGTFAPFSTLGGASILDDSFGTGPAEGMFQAGLTNVPARVGGPWDDGTIEFALGLSNGALDALIGADATTGSGMVATFDLEAGDTAIFQVNFLTNEATPSAMMNDFGFFSVVDSGGATELLSVVADTNSVFFSSGASSPEFGTFNEETGFFTVSFTATTADTYSIGFGVMNVMDEMTASALLIDGIPEPSGLLLLSVLGIAGLGLRRSR